MSHRASYIALGIMIMILVVLDVFVVLRMVSYRKEIAIKDEVISSLSGSQVLTSYLESNVMYSLKYNRSKFETSSIVDIYGNEIDVKKLGERPALVYRFNEHDCTECIGYGLMKLLAFAEKSVSPIFIMARYDDIHPFQRWGRTVESSNVNTYYAPSIIKADEISAPYFFMLYEDMRIGELFIPDKSNPKQTNMYLELISEKYYTP